jgi:hypothetical protein
VSVRIGHSLYRTRGITDDDTWQVRTGHVAASGSDTCQADLAFLVYSWTNPKVTRVTTERVTRGTGMTSAAYVARMMWCTEDDVARMTWQSYDDVAR